MKTILLMLWDNGFYEKEGHVEIFEIFHRICWNCHLLSGECSFGRNLWLFWLMWDVLNSSLGVVYLWCTTRGLDSSKSVLEARTVKIYIKTNFNIKESTQKINCFYLILNYHSIFISNVDAQNRRRIRENLKIINNDKLHLKMIILFMIFLKGS